MHIDPMAEEDCAWYLKPFFWNQRRKYGKVLDAALLWARSPRLFLGVATLYGMIDRSASPLEPALRALITVRVSQLNGCAFCVDLNSATLLRRGASHEKVMTLTGDGVKAYHFSALRMHFNEDAIVELTGLIAFQNLSSKFNAALGVPAQGFCELPQSSVQRGEQSRGAPESRVGHDLSSRIEIACARHRGSLATNQFGQEPS